MQFLRTKIIQPLAEMPPFQKYMVMVVGTLGGIVPIPAVTSFVTVGLGTVTRLGPQGVAVATAWNLILTPVQLMCFVPFAQLGKVMLATFLGLLLTMDPQYQPASKGSAGSSSSVADDKTAGSLSATGTDSWWWSQVRSLNGTVENTHPSLQAIKEANGFSDLLATSGSMLAIGTFAWMIVATATLGGSYAVVKPLLTRNARGGANKS